MRKVCFGAGFGFDELAFEIMKRFTRNSRELIVFTMDVELAKFRANFDNSEAFENLFLKCDNHGQSEHFSLFESFEVIDSSVVNTESPPKFLRTLLVLNS